MSALAWYDHLREQYRPAQLRILLIGESPPDPGDRDRRFFYAPTLAKEDNLYRGVAKALYEYERIDIRDKPAVLTRLRDQGFWLIDAVDEPINKKTRPQRRRLIRAELADLVAACVDLAPERGAIICHGLVYEVAAQPLRHAGVRLLHDQALPFPDRQLARRLRRWDARRPRQRAASMSRISERSYERISKRDLAKLAAIAAEDRAARFARRPRWSVYRKRVICIALCQGAALHYVDGKTGVKDFDVWTYYSAHPEGMFPPRWRGAGARTRRQRRPRRHLRLDARRRAA